MKKMSLLFALAVCCSNYASGKAPQISDQTIRQQIIAASIASYPGHCACPCNSAKNGSACGGRSAWSRKGGYAPICYEREVSNEMVQQRRNTNRQASSTPGAEARGVN